LRGSVARPVLGVVERKAASRSGLLPVMEADAHLRTDPQLAKTSGGEQRAHVSPDPDATFRPRMPVGEQTAGGSLGTIFYPARPTARLRVASYGISFADSSPGGVCLVTAVSRIRCRRENFSLRPLKLAKLHRQASQRIAAAPRLSRIRVRRGGL